MHHDNDEIVTNALGGKQSKLEYRMDLLEPEMLLRVSHVLYTGANKYGAHNWRNITDYREHLGRAMYHITQALADTDQSEDHFANAICRVMFAMCTYTEYTNKSPQQILDKMIPTNFEPMVRLDEQGTSILPQELPRTQSCEYCEHELIKEHLIQTHYAGDVLVCARCECRQQVDRDLDSYCRNCYHLMSRHTAIDNVDIRIIRCSCGCYQTQPILEVEDANV